MKAATKKEEEVQDRVSPPGEVVYEAIFREGEHELDRTVQALAWSGFAAGLSMGFSFVAESLLRFHLPEANWAPAVSKLGYSVGFLIVILGRQQLFTKNTLTVILPLFNRRHETRVSNVARLWAIVLVANLVGAFAFAAALSHTQAFGPELKVVFGQVSAEFPFDLGFFAVTIRAIFAGWLIALMIWLLPFAESARVWVISLLAYLVGLAHLPHVIAGSVAAFYGLLTNAVSVTSFCNGFLLPSLLGNIIGGVAVVAALAHAEFVEERKRRPI